MNSLPLNWSQWSSDPSNSSFAVTSTNPALSGTKSISVTTAVNSQAMTRAWLNTPLPADVQVSAAVYVDTLIPAQVIARGKHLDRSNSDPDPNSRPSYYALQLSRNTPGPLLELVKNVNGTVTSLGNIKAPTYFEDEWLRITLDVQGSTVRGQLFRPDTGQYLNSSGQWQSDPAWALTAPDTAVSGPGYVGLGRPNSYTGTATLDDFSVLLPGAQASTSQETFDSTAVGSLPSNWSQWGLNGANLFAVASPASPAPVSSPNLMAATATLSTQPARAYPNTSYPADLTVSANVYLNTLTGAQVLARGTDLGSATPTYYAVQVSRGMTVKLVKVVSGVHTDISGASVTSGSWIQNQWARATLDLSGNHLKAEIYRLDTGQYLNSSGGWQSAQTWVLDITDSSITAGSQVGMGRPIPQQWVETNYFDNFTVTTAGTGGDAQTFDATPVANVLPTGWQQWSSDGTYNEFTVAVKAGNTKFLSDDQVLNSTGGTGVTARTWNANLQLADVQVTAGLKLPTTQGLLVLARGLGLDTATPSYYGPSFDPDAGLPGPTVKLVRVNGGAETSLGDVPSFTYVSDKWIQKTLYANGRSIRAQVYRTDTGQYLNSQGLWQADPTWALNVTDTSGQALTGAGYAGLARPPGSTTTFYFDNFAVLPVSEENTAPTATVSAPGGTQTGVITVSATATDNVGVTRVELYVDNVLRGVDATAPYSWSLDTSFVNNGSHTVLVKAYDAAENAGTASTSLTTSNNTTLTLPNFTRHQSHIGIARLTYNNGYVPYDDTLLQNNVDVVVVDGPFFADLESKVPATPKLAYTNVSNVYLNYLTDWLDYTEKNGIDREVGFYHVSIATTWSGDSPSTKPVTWFWGVHGYRNGAWSNLTSEARTTATNDVAFGNVATGSVVGDTLNVGYTDKFREINVDLFTPRSGGAYVLEYVSAVDSNGNPTAWSTLTTLADSTSGLTADGTITFDPPANWKAAVVNGSTRLFYVRFKTTTAFSTIPVANTILGRDFAGANGTTSGIIPTFDKEADLNGDGYLNDAEYASRASGKNARFFYESRLFFGDYGQMRYATNPSSLAYKDWAVDFNVRYLTNNPQADGLFVDNSANNLPGTKANFNLLESTAAHRDDYASVLNAIGRVIAPKWIMANTTNADVVPGDPAGDTNADPVIKKVQAYYEEFGIRALQHSYNTFETFDEKIQYRADNDDPDYAVLDSLSDPGLKTDARTQLATLAYYYLLGAIDPTKTALDFFGGDDPGGYWRDPSTNEWRHWSPAAAYNIGAPQGGRSVLATGTDPQNSALTYKVYQRWYTGQGGQEVLVLFKPLSATATNSAVGTIDNATATTVTLPAGTYSRLEADGSLTSISGTTISLRNGEGAILVQTSGGSGLMASGPAETTSIEAPSGFSFASPGGPEPTTGEQFAPSFPEATRTPLASRDHLFSWWVAAAAFDDLASAGESATFWSEEGGLARTVVPLQVLGDPPWIRTETDQSAEDQSRQRPPEADLGWWRLAGVQGSRSPVVETPWLADVDAQPFSGSPFADPEEPSSEN